MFWRKRSKRKQWATQSLMQRLAVVEEGGPLHHAHRPARQVETGPRRRVAFFFAGLVCAALTGVATLAIIWFANAGASDDGAPYALTTTANNPLLERQDDGRLLWWKLPHRPTEKRRGSSAK